ncbi:AraC family transcriptional regulator [Nocardia sp. NRRL WC-3656]|uniref:AraC family transcriptional regulator n=1 Tax=Nocardia sp. NRRL WC-3656 TaxID=1463824 RepID=UPI0009DFE726|nr:AraC family transcriptional regulator [Nocardia sp. NRRL WC-3656]
MNRITIDEAATTDSVLPRERREYWADLMDSYHGPLGYKFPSEGDFQGSAILQRTATYQLVGWRSAAVTYFRDSGLLRRRCDDDYRLLMPEVGRFDLQQNGQFGQVRPGVGCLVTLDRPLEMSMTDGTGGLVMTIPRSEVTHRLSKFSMPSQPFDLTSGLGRVVSDMAAGLQSGRSTLTSGQFDAVSERLVDLLCMLILGDQPQAPGHLVEVENAARQFIRSHANHPDMSVSYVARGIGWSVRQIQLAFKHAGTTPRDVIREERLQMARSRLLDPRYRHVSISTIAVDLGFSSLSAFSKVFRSRFNATPSDVRNGGLVAGSDLSGGSTVDLSLRNSFTGRTLTSMAGGGDRNAST